MKNSRFSFYERRMVPYDEYRRIQYGMRHRIGGESRWKKSVYASMKSFHNFEPNSDAAVHVPPLLDEDLPNPGGYGGIFNLSFSPDGRHLVAACQNRAIIMFDPLLHRQIGEITNAHMDSVNGIKFLDDRLFASCSDDRSVTLWDVRNLKSSVHNLRSHTNWVKNIEYHSADGFLLTSCFDGDVIKWDINRTEKDGDGVHHERLFHLPRLMRMTLSPDLNKLVMSTSYGYMVLIQNLDLGTLKTDSLGLKGWKYPFDRKTSNVGREAERALFGRSRNRPVILKDFPPTNDAKIIHSLQIHPQSWAVVSRNTSENDMSEFTCVHDIQELPPLEGDKALVDIDQLLKGSWSSTETLPSVFGADEEHDALRSSSSFDGGESLVTPATHRFQLNLDNRGGTLLRMGSSSRDHPEGAVAIDSDSEDEPPVPNDDLSGEEDNDGSERTRRRRSSRLEVQGNAGLRIRESFNEMAELLQGEARVVETLRERTLARGLETLLQRQPPVARGAPSTEEQDSMEENRRILNRYMRVTHHDRNFDRSSQFHRRRWRVSRHLSQLTARFREQRNRLAMVAARANGRPIFYVADESTRNSDASQIQQADQVYQGMRERMRSDEIRNIIRNLRGGLDMIMESLIRVRRDLDNEVLGDYSAYGRHFEESLSCRRFPDFDNYYRSTDPDLQKSFCQQRPRLTHYITEANVGKGFIKEIGFSSDGRVICSPYMCGVRLLGFDENCSEMSHCVSGELGLLKELCKLPDSHKHTVVCAQFSPKHTVLVSGCLGGKISFHQPLL